MMLRAILVAVVMAAVGCGGADGAVDLEPSDSIIEGCLSAGAESAVAETDRRVVCTWPCSDGTIRSEVYLCAPTSGWYFDETTYAACE